MFGTCVTRTHSTYHFLVSEYEFLLLSGAGGKAPWGSDCSTTSGVAAETEGTILWGETQSKNIFSSYKLLWVEWVQGKTVAFRLWLLCLVSCLLVAIAAMLREFSGIQISFLLFFLPLYLICLWHWIRSGSIWSQNYRKAFVGCN